MAPLISDCHHVLVKKISKRKWKEMQQAEGEKITFEPKDDKESVFICRKCFEICRPMD